MSSRSRQKQVARERRIALEDAERAAARRRRVRAWAGAVAGAAVLVVALALALGGRSSARSRALSGHAVATAPVPPPRITDLVAAARAAGGRLIDVPPTGQAVHVGGHVAYRTNPPLSGPHNPTWPRDGSYVGIAAPAPELLVHALEHGRIEIQYRPGAPAGEIAQLQELFEESPDRLLLFANRTAMPYALAATAWGHAVVFPHFTQRVFDAIRAFRDRYRDRGPEYIPRPE